MDLNNPKEIDDPLVSHDPKGISIGIMDKETLRGERIIRYSNNIRITNIRIRIRPQIETRILFVFVFVKKLGSEYYSYSSKNLGPNIIRIRIRPKI